MTLLGFRRECAQSKNINSNNKTTKNKVTYYILEFGILGLRVEKPYEHLKNILLQYSGKMSIMHPILCKHWRDINKCVSKFLRAYFVQKARY